MKFLQFLNEMPMLQHLQRDIGAQVPSYYKIKDEYELKDDGYNLYTTETNDGINYAILNIEEKEIKFFSSVKETRIFGKKYYTQKYVYKSKNVSSNLVQQIFFNFILPKHKIIATDDTQSKGGKNMWKNIIKHAIDNNRYEVGYSKNGKDLILFDKDNWQKEFNNGYIYTETFFYIKLK